MRTASATSINFHTEPCSATVCFYVVNAGGSKAYISEGGVALHSGVERHLGKNDIRSGEAERVEPFTLAPGESKEITIPLLTGTEASPFWTNWLEGIKVPQDQVTCVWLHLVGHFSYRDELGIFRRTGFDRDLQPQNRTFYRWKAAEGEYED